MVLWNRIDDRLPLSEHEIRAQLFTIKVKATAKFWFLDSQSEVPVKYPLKCLLSACPFLERFSPKPLEGIFRFLLKVKVSFYLKS